MTLRTRTPCAARKRLSQAAACLDAAASHFRELGDPALHPFAIGLTTNPRRDARRPNLPRLDHPAMGHLDTLTRAAEGQSNLHTVSALTASVLDWSPVYQDAGFGTGIGDGMLAAQMMGSYGIFGSQTFAAGFVLLAPGLHYPEHTHAAEEVYFCLSGTVTLAHGLGGTPFSITPGGYSVTPPHRLHSLTTGPEPALLLYVWRGDLTAPLWVWEPSPTGWERAQWRRTPGEPWKQQNREPVDQAILDQATR